MRSHAKKSHLTPKSIASFSALVVEARRRRSITQSALAQHIGCKQSAISMFERGNRQALSQDKQEALATFLELAWPPAEDSPTSPDADVVCESRPIAYCPHFDCPANYPYWIGTRLMVMPRATNAQAGKHCRYCGEICETHCPHCKAPYEHGAFCTTCGHAYIFVAEQEQSPAAWNQWVSRQQGLLAQMP